MTGFLIHLSLKTIECMMPLVQFDFKFNQINDKVRREMPNADVEMIWRLQNKSLWEKYYYEKLKIIKEKGFVEETWAYYSKSNKNPEEFFKIGFDIALHSENGENGKAIYFYRNLDFLKLKGLYYSNNSYFVLLCKVLTGTPHVDQSSGKHRKPPFLDEKN